MAFFNSFLNKMNFNGDDTEEGYEEGYEEGMEGEYEDNEAVENGSSRSEYRSDGIGNEDNDSASRKRSYRQNSSSSTGPKVVPMHGASSQEKPTEVCMIMPKGYENSSDIAEILLNGKTVVLNLEGMNIDAAQRIIDFTSGACYTMGGNLQKISKKIFIATPKSVELSGDFANMIDDADTSSMNFTL